MLLPALVGLIVFVMLVYIFFAVVVPWFKTEKASGATPKEALQQLLAEINAKAAVIVQNASVASGSQAPVELANFATSAFQALRAGIQNEIVKLPSTATVFASELQGAITAIDTALPLVIAPLVKITPLLAASATSPAATTPASS